MSPKDIPVGGYCYTHLDNPIKDYMNIKIKVCPYWERRGEYGYCNYLKTGDMEEDGTSLLWDMVKECGVNHNGWN